MRFDLLFDDLEAQLDAQGRASDAHERVEAERLGAARSTLRDRFAALIANAPALRVRLVDGSTVELADAETGRDWVAGELPSGAVAVVPIASVASIALGVGQPRASHERAAESPRSALAERLGVGVVLRDLARRRVAIDVVMLGEGAALHGTIDRVGGDHFDLAVHERGTPRRSASVLEHRIIALTAVTMLRV